MDMGQSQGCERFFTLVILNNLSQIIVRQGIAADHDKRFGQQAFRIFDASGCAQRHIFARIGNAHTEL